MSNFALYNANGNLIFDDTGYGVLAKSRSGSRSQGMTINGVYTAMYLQIPAVADEIVAVSAGATYRQLASVVKNWDSVDTGGKVSVYSNFAIGGPLPYLILDTPTNLTSSTDYGVRVYNSSGGTVFDSGLQYFLIRDIISISLSDLQYVTANSSRITQQPPPLVKNHTPCANPYYIIDNLRWLAVMYEYLQGGAWTVGTSSLGIQSVGSNSAIGLNLTLPFNWVVSSSGKDQLHAAAASTQFGPQNILVGELKNA